MPIVVDCDTELPKFGFDVEDPIAHGREKWGHSLGTVLALYWARPGLEHRQLRTICGQASFL